MTANYGSGRPAEIAADAVAAGDNRASLGEAATDEQAAAPLVASTGAESPRTTPAVSPNEEVSERIRELNRVLDALPLEARAAISEAFATCDIDRRDLRQILKAWALGDADQMNVVMLSAFLRQFGVAPDQEAEEDSRA